MQAPEDNRPQSPTEMFSVFELDEMPSSPPPINMRRRQRRMRGGGAYVRRVMIGILPEDSDGEEYDAFVDEELLDDVYDSAYEDDTVAKNLSDMFNELARNDQHQMLSNVLVDCVVCLVEEVVNEQGGMRLVCGHSFHDTCIIEWLKTNDTCPICRKTVI